MCLEFVPREDSYSYYKMGECESACKEILDEDKDVVVQSRDKQASSLTNQNKDSKFKLRSSLSDSIAKGQMANGMVEFIFENGVIYQGQELNGQRHGWGKQTFEDGSSYQGMWLHDLPNGRGVFLQADGGRY